MATKKKSGSTKAKASRKTAKKAGGRKLTKRTAAKVPAKIPAKKAAPRTKPVGQKAGVKKTASAATSAKKRAVAAAPKTYSVAINALGGHVCDIVLHEDCAQDAQRDDIDRAITSFITLEPSALTDVEEHVFRYYLDGKDDFEPGEPGYVEIGSAADVWKHVQFGGEARVGREGIAVYISVAGNCDWEPEHGFQIVFKDGLRVNKVGEFDGHFTNSHAYDDESLEDVIYRPRGGIAPPAGM